MPESTEWISQIVADACEQHPDVTDAVALRMSQLLGDQLCDHSLPPRELTAVADELLAGMSDQGAPELEADHED